MSTEHDQIATLLTRTADEYPVDLDVLWTRTRERVERSETGRRVPSPLGGRRTAVVGVVAATAVIAGTAFAAGSLGDDQRAAGQPAGQRPPNPSETALPQAPLADDVLRVHTVRLPARQRRVEATIVEDQQHSERYSGRATGIGPVTVAGKAGSIVLTSGHYQRFGKPFARFLAATFVRADQSLDRAIRSQTNDLSGFPTSPVPGDRQTDYLWSPDDQSQVQEYADRLVLTSAAGPEVKRWVVRFTDGSSVAAQRFTVPGNDDGFFILVGPHLTDVRGRLKDVTWVGANGEVIKRSDGGGGLP
jgi:hypothetical protein